MEERGTQRGLYIFSYPLSSPPPSLPLSSPLLSAAQVRRDQKLRLSVTLETEVQCDVSRGLGYHWTVRDPGGLVVPLPGVDPLRQSLTLPTHTLLYGNYNAVARVRDSITSHSSSASYMGMDTA